MMLDWRNHPDATLFELVAAADLLGLELVVTITPRWCSIRALVLDCILSHAERGGKAYHTRRWP